VLAVAFAGAFAASAGWVYLGIWAIRELGASSAQLGVAFLLGAFAAGGAGYLGGHVSDHLGRRPLILFGWGAQSVLMISYALVDDRLLLGLVLIMLAGVFGSIGGAADQAMVADLVPPERHEAAYASVRVATNLGVVAGPPVGGLLLLNDSWPTLFVGVSILTFVAFLIAVRYIPRRGAYSPEEPPTRGSFGVIRRDAIFLLFLVSACFAWLVYVAYESVLGISAVDTHGLSPSTWGLLVAINPVMVTFFQLRLTRWTAGFPAAPKLAIAMLLMGLPLLFLTVNASIAAFAVVIFVFVLGEMLWVPTSQAIVAGLAPEDIRGAYMGAFSSTAAFGFALGPFLGLQLRGEFGDDAMWLFFASVSVAAAATGAIATLAALGKRPAQPLEQAA
jgi:predicted MFS family arabinose efflux permease